MGQLRPLAHLKLELLLLPLGWLSLHFQKLSQLKELLSLELELVEQQLESKQAQKPQQVLEKPLF